MKPTADPRETFYQRPSERVAAILRNPRTLERALGVVLWGLLFAVLFSVVR